MAITLKNCTLAFVQHLLNPDDNGKYGCALIFAKDGDAAKALDAESKKVLAEKFGKDAKLIHTQLVGKARYPVHDGDMKSNLAGYEGNAYVNVTRKTTVACFNRDTTPMSEKEIREKMYSGAVVNARVTVYGYDNASGRGLGVGVEGLQFVRDDTRLGGSERVASASDFDALPEEESIAGVTDEEQPW